MKNNINLIRDRADRPLSAAEKLLKLLPLIMVLLYAVAIGAGVVTVRRLETETELVERQIRYLRDHPSHQRLLKREFDNEVIEDLEILEEMVGQYEKRWLWNEKLQIIQRHMPRGVFLVSLAGDSGERLQIKGEANDADGKGMERIRELIRSLETDDRFRARIGNVTLMSSRALQAERPGQEPSLQFDILCRAAETR